MTSIILKSIIIENFKKLSNFQLNLDNGNNIYLIKGSNGSGKSSIFEAIYTCLYGSKTGTTDSDVIQKGKLSSTLQLNIEINGEEYIIERILGKGSKVTITKSGLVLSDKSSTSKSIIEKLIPEYILTISMLQVKSKNEIKQLIKEVITSVLNIDDFFEKLKNKINEFNNILNQINQNKNIINNDISNINNNISNYNNRIINIDQQILSYNNQISEIDSKLNGITIDYIIKVKNDVTNEYNKRYNDVKSNYDIKLKNLNNDINEYKKLDFEFQSSYNQLLNEIKIHKQELVNNLQNTNSTIERNISTIDANINSVNNDIQHKTLELSKDICPLCKQSIPQESKNKIKDSIENLKLESKTLLDNKNSLLEKLNNNKIIYEKEVNDAILKYSNLVNEVNDKIKNNKINIDNLNTEITKVNNEILSIDTNLIYNQVIQDLKVNLDILNNSSIYTNMINNKTSLQSNIETLNSEKIYINDQIKISNDKNIDLNNNIMNLDKEYEEYERKLNIYSYWNDQKLLKSILLKRISLTINSLLKEKYQSVLEIDFDLTDKDIEIIVKNMNNERINIENLSQGEFAITTLSIICTFRDVLSSKYNFNWMLLDEFLDRLDKENMELVIKFLTDKIEGNKFIITHNTYAQELQCFTDIIDMEVFQ